MIESWWVETCIIRMSERMCECECEVYLFPCDRGGLGLTTITANAARTGEFEEKARPPASPLGRLLVAAGDTRTLTEGEQRAPAHARPPARLMGATATSQLASSATCQWGRLKAKQAAAGEGKLEAKASGAQVARARIGQQSSH